MMQMVRTLAEAGGETKGKRKKTREREKRSKKLTKNMDIEPTP